MTSVVVSDPARCFKRIDRKSRLLSEAKFYVGIGNTIEISRPVVMRLDNRDTLAVPFRWGKAGGYILLEELNLEPVSKFLN